MSSDQEQHLLGEYKLIRENSRSIVLGTANSIHQSAITNYGSVQAAGRDIVNTPEQKQALAETAQEIKQLLDQLSQDYPTGTMTEQAIAAAKTVEQIEQKPVLKDKILQILTVGGVEALKQSVDHPVSRIAIAMLQEAHQ